MILEDTCELLHGQVRESRANILECLIVRCKDGDVHHAVNRLHQIGFRQSTSQCAKAGLFRCGGDVFGYGQDLIDDVNDPTSEIRILTIVLSDRPLSGLQI